jgi:ABC-type multidrug transport system ATPase subunit
MNIIRATSGRAEVLGTDSSQIRGRLLEPIGYVSENQEMPEWMTVDSLVNYRRPFYPTWDTNLEAEPVKTIRPSPK